MIRSRCAETEGQAPAFVVTAASGGRRERASGHVQQAGSRGAADLTLSRPPFRVNTHRCRPPTPIRASPRMGRGARNRLVHHPEVIVLQGESYRLKDRAKEVVPKESR